jgi:hypothetical protein
MILRARLAQLAKSDVVVAAVVLAVLLNLAFFPYLWGGKTLMSASSDAASIYGYGAADVPSGLNVGAGAYKGLDPGAAAWQTEPDFAQIRHQVFVEENAPLWNPTVGFGEPLAADMISQPYFPLSLLVIAHPSTLTYNWWCVLRLYMAGLGAFCFLRLFTGFSAALAAGISLTFAGYYLLYYNIAHLSVETLIPWLFYVNERLIRTPSLRQIIAAASVDVLTYLGGMPESQLLALVFAYLYALYRLASDPSLRKGAVRSVGALAVEGIAGVGGAAFLLLPFIEYVRLSLNQHEAANIGGALVGLQHDWVWTQLFTYTVPLIFGPAWENVTTGFSGFAGIRGFFGITALYLALVAVLGAVSDRARHFDRWTGIVPFFAIATAFLLMKRFGSFAVNWVGGLPGFSLIAFYKYEEALLAFSVAMLAGMGVGRISESRPSGVIRWWAGVISLCWLTVIFLNVRSLVPASAIGRAYTVYGLAFAIAILAAALLASALPGIFRRSFTQRWSVVALLAVLTVEVTSNYLLPIHFFVNTPMSGDLDAYRGAPFVAYLQRETLKSRDRFIGQDSILYPDWAAAFGLFDVRDLDALYDQRYLPFVRAFLDPLQNNPALVDRFTSPEEVDTERGIRFLALSSVRFVVTDRDRVASQALLPKAYSQNVANLAPQKRNALAFRPYTIDGVQRQGLLEHPPFTQLPIHVSIPRGARKLLFEIGMDPAVYSPRTVICGAGATFTLEIRDAEGRTVQLFKRSIDPKHDFGQRHWIDESVNVYRWAGRTVDLLLSTAPWPGKSTCADWALWGGGEFAPVTVPRGPRSPFTLAYRDGRTYVYRFEDAIPRVAIYQNVRVTQTSAGALAMLVDPKVDVHRTVLVTPHDSEDVPSLGLINSDVPVRAGILQAYTSQYVRAQVSLSARGVVVLNDTDYPGWQAYVDGKPQPTLLADGLFRGVVVEPGEHSIEFKYESQSFRIGLIITILTIACGIGAWVRGRLNRKAIEL